MIRRRCLDEGLLMPPANERALHRTIYVWEALDEAFPTSPPLNV